MTRLIDGVWKQWLLGHSYNDSWRTCAVPGKARRYEHELGDKFRDDVLLSAPPAKRGAEDGNPDVPTIRAVLQYMRRSSNAQTQLHSTFRLEWLRVVLLTAIDVHSQSWIPRRRAYSTGRYTQGSPSIRATDHYPRESAVVLVHMGRRHSVVVKLQRRPI